MGVGMFLQNLLLALTARGLGTCVQVSIAGYPEIVREQLGIAADMRILCGLAVGYQTRTFRPTRCGSAATAWTSTRCSWTNELAARKFTSFVTDFHSSIDAEVAAILSRIAFSTSRPSSSRNGDRRVRSPSAPPQRPCADRPAGGRRIA